MSMLDSILMTSLQSALQASQLRQNVYANNIANANTPGFKQQDVQFESMLQAALANDGFGASGTLPMLTNQAADLQGATSPFAVSPVVTTDNSTSGGPNGNNVNVDAQMAGLAENQIDYAALVQELNSQFTQLRTAITGTGS